MARQRRFNVPKPEQDQIAIKVKRGQCPESVAAEHSISVQTVRKYVTDYTVEEGKRETQALDAVYV